MSTASDGLELKIDLDGVESIVESLMTEGYILRDFTNITEEETEAAYAMAYHLFDQGQCAKAEKLFEFLCQLDHYEGRFWIGLGAARQMQNHYEQAVKAYALAGVHDMENPVPALRAAECYLALNQLDEAQSGAQAALHWAGDRAEHEELRARAQLVLEAIRRRKEGSS